MNDACIIPQSIKLMAAPVEIPDGYDLLSNWTKEIFTLDFSPVRAAASNNLLWISLHANMFMSRPASIFRAEPAKVKSADIDCRLAFTAERDGLVQGIGCWFSADLAPTISISNGPPLNRSNWTQILLPLERPRLVSAGDILNVRIQTSANCAQWQWQVVNGSGLHAHNGQSTLSGQLRETAKQINMMDMPARSSDGTIDLFILKMMDGSTSVKEMAENAADKFPMRFNGFDQALEHVQLVASIYRSAE